MFHLECGLLGGQLLLAQGYTLTGLVECGGQLLDLGARRGQRGFLRFTAFQAGELLVFDAVDLLLGEMHLVFDGFGLRGSLHRVLLGAEARDLLAMTCDLAFQAGAERFLAVQRIRYFSGLTLRCRQCRLGLRYFSGQGARCLSQPGTLQINAL